PRYVGLLDVWLALTTKGIRVVESDARCGHRETQALLALLESPRAGLLYAAATGRLAEHAPLRWREGAAVAVVVAAEGYPGQVRSGARIVGADQPGVLHCGTRLDESGELVAAGGRVVCCVGTGPDLGAARSDAYGTVARIAMDGGHYR